MKYFALITICVALFSCTKQDAPEPDKPGQIDLDGTEWVNKETTSIIYFDSDDDSEIMVDFEYWPIEWWIEGGKVYVYISAWHMPVDQPWIGEFTQDGILFNGELLYKKATYNLL